MLDMTVSVSDRSDTTRFPPPAARWARLIPMTGMTVAQFWHIVRDVTTRYPKRRRPGRPWGLPLPLRVLLVLVALRPNLTERALAALFGISQASVNRTITNLLPTLAGLLPDPTAENNVW